MSPSLRGTLLVAAIFLVHAGVHASTTFADAGFSLAAAEALASGDGFSPWLGAPWTETFDRPLWVFLLTVPAALGLRVGLAAKALGLGLGLAGLALVGAAVRQLDLRGPWPWVGAGLLALHPWWTLWTVAASGEVLYTVLLVGGLVRVAVELTDDRRVPFGGLLLGLAGVARWDVLVPLAPVGLGVWVLARGARRGVWRSWTLGGMVVPGLLWVAFREATFDPLLPAFGGGYWAWDHRSLSSLARSVGKLIWRPGRDADLLGWAALAGGLVLVLRDLRRRPLVALFLLAGLGELASLVVLGGDWAGTGRRLQVLTALAVPAVVRGVAWAWRRTDCSLWLRVGLVALLAWGVVGLGQKSLRAAWHPETSVAHLRKRVDHILTHARDHGVRPVFVADPDPQAWLLDTDLPVVDLSGRSGDADSADRARMRAELLGPGGPTYIHLHGGWARRYQLSRDPRWTADFVEVRGYPIGRGKVHVGTFVRRSALEAGARRRGDSVDGAAAGPR